MSVLLVKYFILTVCVLLLFKWKYPVINAKQTVKCPDIKVNLIDRGLSLHEMIVLCGKQMKKKGYSDEEIKEFVKDMMPCKNSSEIVHTFCSYFYVY